MRNTEAGAGAGATEGVMETSEVIAGLDREEWSHQLERNVRRWLRGEGIALMNAVMERKRVKGAGGLEMIGEGPLSVQNN